MKLMSDLAQLACKTQCQADVLRLMFLPNVYDRVAAAYTMMVDEREDWPV